jgi:hypothetical protein
MKGHHYNFRELKDSTITPPPLKRARGGRTELEGRDSYAEGDPKTPRARSKRRAAGPRGRTALGHMTGGGVKHRADRPARGRASGGSSGYSGPIPPELLSPTFTITHGNGPPPPPNIPVDQSSAQLLNAATSLLGKSNATNNNSNNDNWRPDLGYAIYSNGTPVGIKGVAPFAGGPDDISAGSKRGGRINRKHRG